MISLEGKLERPNLVSPDAAPGMMAVAGLVLGPMFRALVLWSRFAAIYEEA